METTLSKEHVALQEAMLDLPDEWRAHLMPAVEAVCEQYCRRQKILQLVQDALGTVKLDMKYLMFDLEATRRERDALEAQLP